MATWRMTMTGPIGRRTAQAATAVAVALVLGGAATRHAAAEDQQPIDSNVAAVVNDCNLQGGTATTDWTFDENGDATQAVVSCDDGANSWFECADNEGYYCDGEPPTDLTGSGGVVHHLPVLPGQIATQPVAAPSTGRPVIAAPLTGGDPASGGNASSGGAGNATSPSTGGDGSGTAAPSEPTPPSGGTLPGTGHAPKPHKGHKHHGHQPGQVTPLVAKAAKTAHPAKGKAAQAAAHHAKGKPAQHGTHKAK